MPHVSVPDHSHHVAPFLFSKVGRFRGFGHTAPGTPPRAKIRRETFLPFHAMNPHPLLRVLSLALLACATSLRAQTVEQIVIFNHSKDYTVASDSVQFVDSSFFVGTFDPFDSSLGTLDSFVIEWTLANTATGNLVAGGSVSISVVGHFRLNDILYHPAVSGNSGTGGPAGGLLNLSAPIAETDHFAASEAGTTYDSALLTAVTGSEAFTVSYDAPINFSFPFGSSATFTAATIGSVKVTYHYTAAIPEPSTYAALVGLAAFGLTMWRRRQIGQRASA